MPCVFGGNRVQSFAMKLFLLFLCLVLCLPWSARAQYEQSENEIEIQTAENAQKVLEVKPVTMVGKYRWPLDIVNGISSSFQEFRSNHFHAGFDLRTMQKTGYPVYAIADGVIYKIRMDKRGSGRGLYLKHDDGNTSIYFHLDRFETKLEDILRQVRRIKGYKYFGNYFLKEPLRYKRGELIGYSGETGAGFPHLHLEIRDSRQFALNPFKLVEQPSRDNNSPVLNGVLFRNTGSDPINGKIGEHYFKLKRGKLNQFSSTQPVIVTGPFDLVLNARDISDSGRYVSPYEISVSIDEHNYFDLKFDRFQWADNNQLGFVYDLLYSSPSSYYFNLFSQEGFLLEEKRVPLQGIINSLEKGEHRLNIRIRDNFDNESTGVLVFQKVGKPELVFGGAKVNGNVIQLAIDKLDAEDADAININLKDGNGKTLYAGSLKYTTILERKEFTLKGAFNGIHSIDFNFLEKGIVYYTERFLLKDDWLAGITDIDYETFINRDDVYIKINKPVLAPGNLGLTVIQGGESLEVKAEPAGGFFYFRFKPLNNSNNVLLHFGIFKEGQKIVEIQKKLFLISLKRGVVQRTEFGEFTARFAGRSVYEPKVMQLEERDYKSDFPVLSRQVDLSPYFFPFLDEVLYTFTKNLPDPQQVGIFKYNPKYNHWNYRYTTYESATKTYKTKVLSSGTFALMRDIFPPRIFFKKPIVKHKKNLKRLVVKITDKGKGVNDGSLRVRLNGKWVDCEYDPDWRTVVIEDLKHLQVGKNTFSVEIKDYAGHKAAKVYTIYLQ